MPEQRTPEKIFEGSLRSISDICFVDGDFETIARAIYAGGVVYFDTGIIVHSVDMNRKLLFGEDRYGHKVIVDEASNLYYKKEPNVQ